MCLSTVPQTVPHPHHLEQKVAHSVLRRTPATHIQALKTSYGELNRTGLHGNKYGIWSMRRDIQHHTWYDAGHCLLQVI